MIQRSQISSKIVSVPPPHRTISRLNATIWCPSSSGQSMSLHGICFWPSIGWEIDFLSSTEPADPFRTRLVQKNHDRRPALKQSFARRRSSRCLIRSRPPSSNNRPDRSSSRPTPPSAPWSPRQIVKRARQIKPRVGQSPGTRPDGGRDRRRDEGADEERKASTRAAAPSASPGHRDELEGYEFDADGATLASSMNESRSFRMDLKGLSRRGTLALRPARPSPAGPAARVVGDATQKVSI